MVYEQIINYYTTIQSVSYPFFFIMKPIIHACV